MPVIINEFLFGRLIRKGPITEPYSIASLDELAVFATITSEYNLIA
ncbi:MAG: hypothetical protein V3T49_02815 [Dehalococcoidia bacterium]